MNYAKILGLLAVTAAALMAFASTASATLTEAEGDPMDVGDTIHASSEGAVSFTGSFTVTCQKSTLSTKIESNGATTAEGPITELSFTECGNHTVSVTSSGFLNLEKIGSNTRTLTVASTKITFLLHSIFLGTLHCTVEGGVDLGTFTGKGHPNGGPRIHIGSGPFIRLTTDGACGEHLTLEGSYEVTTPADLTSD